MKGLVAWFAQNGVVANLVMVVIVVVGLMTIPTLKKEVFPEFSIGMISVSVSYRGAAPEEVEEAVCVRVEEAVQGLDGIKKISSTASEGIGTVILEVETGYNDREVLDDVKARVDAISTFPEETEKPVIQTANTRFQVINVSVSGETDELTLKRLGEQVRDELSLLPEISQVELRNARPYEISIEVSEEALRRYRLTFDDVARAVRRTSIDLPGGSVKTGSGEILLRTKGQAYRGVEFEKIPLITRNDGSRLHLADVARVVDQFEDSDKFAWLDGKRTVMVQVFRVGDQNALEVARAVHEYVNQAKTRLPDGISITTWADAAKILQSRVDLLVKNAMSGLFLVFLVLALFLRLRLAFWVTIGIPISFLGAIAMMPVFDVSINMLSLFSFILVLGIVVDDAIVVGENVFAKQEATKNGLTSAILGTREVAIPVIFGVLTTVAAFSPMLFVPGSMGKVWRVIPLIVVPTLLFSLVESNLVLPYHISHYRPQSRSDKKNFLIKGFNWFFGLFANGMEWFIQRIYKPVLQFSLEWRYLTVAAAVSTLVLTAGLVTSGIVKFIYFPQVEGDNVVADLTMPQETPVEVTTEAIRRIEESAFKLDKEIQAETGHSLFRHILTAVGEQPFRTQSNRNMGTSLTEYSNAYLGEVNIELLPSENRAMSSNRIANRWREITGTIPGAVELTFTSDLIGGGKAIDIQLAGSNVNDLREAVAQTKMKLTQYAGVVEVADSFRGGKPELKLAILPKAESLGLSLQDLGRQVRQGFFGEEAQRIQRGRDDVRVMVRYPLEKRRSLNTLEKMRVRSADGNEVPFSAVATFEMGRGFATINRVDRRRTINITAEIDESKTNANQVLGDMQKTFFPNLRSLYPNIAYSFEGEQRSQAETLEGLGKGFIVAMLVIYAMMAIPFRSYIQPIIVISAVPFGVVGAIWGHLFMGLSVSILSMLGVVALAGVVVNDSLVLVSFINSHRKKGILLKRAVHEAGLVRFRPIILTSLTTAAGITPLMMEKSVQAQFLIPMAVSLAFGVLFATFVTLGLVPSIYLILEDFKGAIRWIFGRAPETTRPFDDLTKNNDVSDKPLTESRTV